MKITVIYSLAFFLIALMLGGCAASNSQINPETGKKYSEQEYKIILDKQNFVNSVNAIARIEVDQNAKVVGTMLIEPGNPILYAIKMRGVSNVHNIELLETERLNLNRVMIDHSDYFWDSVTRELLIVLNIPHAYLLDNELRLKLNILIEDDNKNIDEMQRYYLFWHKPMKGHAETYMSFEYLNNYSDLEAVDSFMRSELKEEADRFDRERLSGSYKYKVNQVQ